MKPIRPLPAVLTACLTAFLAGCAGLQPAQSFAPMAIRQCEALAGMNIPGLAIGLPTRGATIVSASRAAAVAPYRDAEGEHLLPTPERCVVLGRITSVDTAAPPINFAVNLPLANWNGRALQSGGGGLGGQLITAPGNKASGRFDPNPVNVPYPITQGYVTFGSDNGHAARDFAFTRNDEAVRNWAYEEIKKTRDAVLTVVVAAYGRQPTHVFFSGESAGAREALRAAQKFPDDYDGIIGTSPVISWNAVHLFDNVVRDRLIEGFLDGPGHQAGGGSHPRHLRPAGRAARRRGRQLPGVRQRRRATAVRRRPGAGQLPERGAGRCGECAARAAPLRCRWRTGSPDFPDSP